MGRIHNEEFKQEAVRIVPTIGLKRHQVAYDLQVGHLTPSKWIQTASPADLPLSGDINLAKEKERLPKRD